jgi:hypothetical protein
MTNFSTITILINSGVYDGVDIELCDVGLEKLDALHD